MAELKPVGIDQTTGQQREVAAGDTVNVGNEIEIVVKPGYDYSNVPTRVFAQFPYDTPVLLGSPASGPSTAVGLAWSPNGEFLAAGDTSSPYFHFYQKTGTTLNRLDDPASLPAGAGSDVAWSPNGQYLTVACFSGAGPFITYQVDGSTLTPLADPASLPFVSGNGVDYTGNGQYMTIGTSGSPSLYTYEVDGATRTLLSTPASAPNSTVNDVAWSPDGRFLAVVETSAPYLNIYEHDGQGTLTRLADPSTMPGGFGTGVSWSHNGEFLFVGSTGAAPDLLFYQRSGSTFTGVHANDYGSGYPNDVRWSPNDRYAVVAGFSGTYRMFERNGNIFTQLTSPASLPGSQYYAPDWSPDGQFIAIGGASTGLGGFGLYQIQTTLPSSGIVKTNGKPLAGS